MTCSTAWREHGDPSIGSSTLIPASLPVRSSGIRVRRVASGSMPTFFGSMLARARAADAPPQRGATRGTMSHPARAWACDNTRFGARGAPIPSLPAAGLHPRHLRRHRRSHGPADAPFRRTRVRPPSAARSRGAHGRRGRAHRAHRPQRHRQVVAAQGDCRRSRPRRRRDPPAGRPARDAGRAGAHAAAGVEPAREPGAARAPRDHPRRARALAHRGTAGRVHAPLRPRRSRGAGVGVRRRAEARGAGPRAGHEARPAAARRADQPPRHRRHRPGRGAAAERSGDDRHHPRPRVPRSRRHAHRRAGPGPAALVPGQLRRLHGAQGRPAGRGGGRQPQVRPVLEAGRGVDPQGCRGAAHPRRGPRAAAGAAARASARSGATAWGR